MCKRVHQRNNERAQKCRQKTFQRKTLDKMSGYPKEKTINNQTKKAERNNIYRKRK